MTRVASSNGSVPSLSLQVCERLLLDRAVGTCVQRRAHGHVATIAYNKRRRKDDHSTSTYPETNP